MRLVLVAAWLAAAPASADDGFAGLLAAARARPAPPQLLHVTPAVAEIALSKDFGWTLGPSVLVRDGQPRPGWSFTAWHQAKGAWRVVFELDVPAARAKIPAVVERVGPGGLDFSHGEPSALDPLAFDRTFCKMLGEDAREAYLSALLPDARVVRAGLATHGQFLAGLPATLTCSPLGSGRAASGEVGYAYGTWAGGGKQGRYVRVWRATPGGMVALDVASDAP